MKDYLVHRALAIQCVSVCIILVVAKIKGFRICIVDVRTAYLQSVKPFMRKIFVTNHASEFKISPEECLELLKPIYGLADSEDIWHRTLDDHVQIELKMTPTIIYPSLYFQIEDEQLFIINGSYVDDLLRAGTFKRKLIQMLPLNDSRQLETNKHSSPTLECISLNLTACTKSI